MLLSVFNTVAFAEDIRETYIIITDTVEANSGFDVSDKIQEIIDANPNRTIYFPDGEYLVSKPIMTPANPRKSVSLELSDFAGYQGRNSRKRCS